MTWLVKLFLMAGVWITSQAAFGPKRLYTMDLPVTPVSVKVVGKELIIVGPWYIGGISNIHWKFRQSNRMKPRIINKDIPNPRAVGMIPGNAFKGNKGLMYWVSSWGTNDTSGGMYVMKPTTTYSVWKDISIDSGWSYERSQWVDMNKDGRTDCLTARFRGGVGQLLWFSQPAGQTLWGQQIIHEGMADGNFIGFVKGKKPYILVAGLQFSTLGLYWSMSRTNLWSSSRMIRHRVIDNYGKFYDVQYIDLNKDGKPDCLTTTVNIGNSRGHVLGYEIPDDLQNKIWKRRVLAAGFDGDYSPGRATAYWSNKWKKKTERPSVFLSGAGAEVLYILTPKPAKSGWGYIKSSLKAGVGMIGLPYIGDIDGDSYPEVFVPQGNKLHVFSYDYNAAVAQPPAKKTTAGKVTPRPVVKFVPPFFRPTAATLAPLIPKDATPLPPLAPFVPKGGPLGGNSPGSNSESNSRPSSGTSVSSGGLTGNEATLFGSTGILPSSGNTENNNPPPLPRLPPLNLGTNNNNNNNPPSGPSNPLSGPGTSVGRGSPPVGGSTNFGSGRNNLFTLVNTNQGPSFIPVGNSPTNNNNNNVNGNPPVNNGNSPVQFPWLPGSSSNSGTSPVGNPPSQPQSTNNQIVPLNGGQNQQIVPIEGSPNNGNNRITSNENQNLNVVPIGGETDPPKPPLEPVFEDFTDQPLGSDYYEDVYDSNHPSVEPPSNLILSITSQSYRYRQEASDACSFDNRVLCNIRQLEASRSAGPIPLIEWGWFEEEGRAAHIQDCVPGEVKWPGYKCHNGVVGHLPVMQSTELKGFCCAVLKGVNITDRKFSNYHDAEEGCRDIGSHVCSLEEMFDVWKKSSYKSDVWGWYKDNVRLIKMVHTCDPNEILWPGYNCVERKLATSKIVSHVQESAYCCPENFSPSLVFNFLTLFIGLLISLAASSL